jgi:D-ribose pyranose/furanose isomerase RbsD
MLTLYIEQTNNSIIISKQEFEQILEILRKNMDVKIIDDADYLTEAEMKIREEAMEELERGETISFEDWQKELREREKLELNTDV